MNLQASVRRNKTDRADATGLVEVARWEAIRRVPIRHPSQDIQGLHRTRALRKTQRTAAINRVRELLHEFGVIIPLGSAKVHPAEMPAREDAENELPMALGDTLKALPETITATEKDMRAIEERLQTFTD